MDHWTSGYVADIDYTFGYYQELNVVRAQFAMLSKRLGFPKIRSACELGFGQGLSTVIHGAASDIAWYGTDFNPSHASFANQLAKASGADIHIYDDSFEEFINRPDLPNFDFIALHGIWSWVSDENRKHIVEFIRTKLNIGGVVFLSFNTHPGWSTFAPLRHLMVQHKETVGSEGKGIVHGIDGAIQFAEALMDTKPAYMTVNPQVSERLAKLKEQDRHYLAHEYFNRDWHPMHFSTLASALEPAKLNYACSAVLMDHIDVVNLHPNQSEFLNSISDLVLRESTRDFMINQQFRRDYWTKGVSKLSSLDQFEAMSRVRVLLGVPREDIKLTITGMLGEINLKQEIYNALLDELADLKTKTITELNEKLVGTGMSVSELVQAILVLLSTGQLCIVQPDETIEKAKETSRKLNALLVDRARSNNEVTFLASPVSGGGVSVSRFNQLFILAYSKGMHSASELAKFVWQIISRQGQRIIKEKKTIESEEDSLQELESQAKEFLNKKLPVFKALLLVE